MASQIEEILGRNINSVKELKKAIGELQNSLIGLDAESQEFKDTSYKLAAAQDELTKVTKAGRDENIAATDSIVGMQKEYKKLYDQYKLLSEEQRNSDFGKNMAESLETLSNKLNDTKKGVGNFKDNIGRYAGDITDAFSKMGLSVGALQGPLNIAKNGFTALNATMKANPVGIIITAITALIALFKKMKDAVSQNEELQMRWNEAMAKFQPIVDAAKNALDNLAKAFTAYVEWISKCVQKIREFGAAVTDFLGITKGAKQQLQEQQKIYDDIAKSTSNLTKTKRDYQKLDAEDKARVEALREEASEATNLEEKQRLLTEAKEIQAQIDQRAIEVAQEELRILEEQASLTANDAAANDKLAAATARVSQAQATAAANARMFNNQLSATTETTTTATSSMKNYREEAKKLYEQLIENSKTETIKLTEKYEKEKKLLEKYHYDTSLLAREYENNISKIRFEAWKKQEEEQERMLDRSITLQARMWKREMQLYTGDDYRQALVQADFYEEAIRKLTDFEYLLNEEIENVDKSYETLFQIIFGAADLSKIKDYNYVKEIVNSFETLEGEEVNNAARKLFATFDEEGWAALTDKIQMRIKELAAEFGMDIENWGDIEPLFAELGDSYASALGDSFLKQINSKELKANLYEGLAHTIKDFGGDTTSATLTTVFQGLNDAAEKSITTLFNTQNLWERVQEHILKTEYEQLDAEKEWYEANLETFTGTTDQKIEFLERYFDVLEQIRTREEALTGLNQQRTLEMVDNLIDATDSLAGALGTIKSSYDTLVESELRAGKIDEKQAQEKKKRLLNLEKWQTGFSIATIAADAAAGLFSIWKGYAMERGTINPQTAAAAGPGAAVALGALNAKSLVSAISKSASLAATATAQIMAARNGIVASVNNFSAESAGSSGSGDVGASPILIDSTPYSYTRTLQTEEDVDNLNQRPIVVRVSDILDGIDTHNVQVTESSF